LSSREPSAVRDTKGHGWPSMDRRTVARTVATRRRIRRSPVGAPRCLRERIARASWGDGDRRDPSSKDGREREGSSIKSHDQSLFGDLSRRRKVAWMTMIDGGSRTVPAQSRQSSSPGREHPLRGCSLLRGLAQRGPPCACGTNAASDGTSRETGAIEGRPSPDELVRTSGASASRRRRRAASEKERSRTAASSGDISIRTCLSYRAR